MDSPKIPHIADYDTGYKKPPKTSQFKKGKSGNPSGRPRGALNKLPKDELRLQDLFIKEAYRDVPIKEGSKRIKLPLIGAVLRSLAIKAAQGNIRAAQLLLNNVKQIEKEREKDKEKKFNEALDYKIGAEKMIADAKKQGHDIEKEIMPHPDNVTLDFETLEVVTIGPIDQKSKKLWDKLWMHKKLSEDMIKVHKAKRPKGKDAIKQNKDNIDLCQYFLEVTERALINRFNEPLEKVVKDISRWAETQRRIEQDILPTKPKSFKIN